MINRDLKNYRMPRHPFKVAGDIVATWLGVVFIAVTFYAAIFLWLI